MTLDEAIKDLLWKATPFGETEDGAIAAYLIPAGAVHRLVGAAQGAGISAALRSLGVTDEVLAQASAEFQALPASIQATLERAYPRPRP